jgi:hypothetical protein
MNFNNNCSKVIIYKDFFLVLLIVIANYINYPKFFYINNSFSIFIFNYIIILTGLLTVIIFNKRYVIYNANPLLNFSLLYFIFIIAGDPYSLGKIRGVLLTIFCIILIINIDRNNNYFKILKYSTLIIIITGLTSRFSDYGFNFANHEILGSDFKINMVVMCICYLCFNILKKRYFITFLLFSIILLFSTRTSLLALSYFLILHFLNISSRMIKLLNLIIILLFAIYPWYLELLPANLVETFGNFSTFRTYFQQLIAMTSDFDLFRFETSYSYRLLSSTLLNKDLIYSIFENNFLYELQYTGQCPHNSIFENVLDYGVSAFFLYAILFLGKENRYQSICIGMYLIASGFQCEFETAPFVIPFLISYTMYGRLDGDKKFA